MPVNAGIDFKLAQEEYNKAENNTQKLMALQKMYATLPKHKGSESLQKEIKSKISKIKAIIDKEKQSKRRGYSLSIKKEGAATVIIVGLTNSGKSYVLSRITNAKPKISEYEYTTKLPEIGTMDYNGIKLQLVELPAFFKGYSDSGKGPSFMAIARTADLILIVLNGEEHLDEQLFLIEQEFRDSFIDLNKVPTLVLVNKNEKRFFCGYKVANLESLKEDIWKGLDLIYVYTKTPGKQKDYPPVALAKGSSVEDLARMVHKDFVRRFRFARVWGRSVKHDGAKVGLAHVLGEEDTIEFHLS